MAGFRARSHGTCGEALDEIKPGDVIDRFKSAERTRGTQARLWAHVGCLLARPTQVYDRDAEAGTRDMDRQRFLRDMLGADAAFARGRERDEW